MKSFGFRSVFFLIAATSESKKTVKFHPLHHRRPKKRMELVSDVIGTEKNGRIVQTTSLERKKTVGTR